MILDKTQLHRMYRDGFIVLPQAVSIELTTAARQAINHDLGESGLIPDQLPVLREKGYCPDLCCAPVITDLANRSNIRHVAEQLLGALQPITKSWILLRFPGPSSGEGAGPIGHIDGIGTGVNGTPAGRINRNFTLMAVVYLHDLPDVNAGNFTVWPGSHWMIRDYFDRNGPQALKDGMPCLDYERDPVVITGKQGDVVLCHHLLVHGPSPNTSANIRYAAIFRIRHRDLDTVGHDALTDMWREWPGVRAT